MIKFKQGNIGNCEGEWKDIIVKAATPNKLKDILIGGTIMLVGVAYLTYTAFRNGSRQFEEAELKTMKELGLI
jgi:hypothetical protein